MVEGFPTADEVRDVILEYYKKYRFYAYNAPFENRFLTKEFNFNFNVKDVLKPVKTKLNLEPKQSSLKFVCAKMGIPLTNHRALDDALAIYNIINRLGL